VTIGDLLASAKSKNQKKKKNKGNTQSQGIFLQEFYFKKSFPTLIWKVMFLKTSTKKLRDAMLE